VLGDPEKLQFVPLTAAAPVSGAQGRRFGCARPQHDLDPGAGSRARSPLCRGSLP
jgi:hypothetical protein